MDNDDTTTAQLYLSNGNGTFTSKLLTDYKTMKGDLTNLIIGDYNGDGKDDFIRQEKGSLDDDDTTTADVYFSNGSNGSFTRQAMTDFTWMKGDFTNLIVADYNGDGATDFIRQEKGSWDDDNTRTAELYLSDKGRADYIIDNVGNDIIYTGNGDDYAESGAGNDLIGGKAGNDYADGGDGDDTLYGDEGNDILKGGAGSDTLYADQGNDYAYGGDGNDTMYGDGRMLSQSAVGDGNDYLSGGNGNDVIRANGGNDQVFGDDGNDTLMSPSQI